MKIGLTYDLKTSVPVNGQVSAPFPSDDQEEFDSPATIEAIASVLRGMGHQVDLLGDGRPFLEKVLAAPPDFVFNFAEGHGVSRSREARVPAVLEMLGIPYSGSDPLTLATTLDKDCARRIVASVGLAVPRGLLIQPGDDLTAILASQSLSLPAIVKPAWEGSSKGIWNRCLIEPGDDPVPIIETVRQVQRQPVLVEEYIEGEELTVGVIGNCPPRILGVMRVLPVRPSARFVYSLEVKRDYLNQVRYECPPRLPAADVADVEQAALAAYRALGCRDVARVDFRLRNGVPYFLEVNPLPGLNPESSDLVIMTRLLGWSHERLITAILQEALARQSPGVEPAQLLAACP